MSRGSWGRPRVEGVCVGGWSPSSVTDLLRGEERKLSKVEAEEEEMLLEVREVKG